MKLSSRLTTAIVKLAVVTFVSGSALSALPVPQFKPTRSDEDISAIGHRNVGKGVNFYSLDKEEALGKALAQEVERSSRFVDDPLVTAYLDRLAQKVAKNSDARFPITIRIIDSDVLDALALPGGFQYINRALILQTEAEAELAAVLAHGIAHTAIRSSTMEATKGELMQLATVPPMVLGPGGWAGYGLYEGLNLSIPVTYLKFRRDAEVVADFFSLQYLYKTGYDPECYIRFFERVWPQTSAGKNVPKVFSPFPPLPERLQYMNKEIATILPRRDDAIVSSSEFQEIKERLRAWQSQKGFKSEENQQKPTLRKPTDISDTESPILMPDCR